MRTWRGLWASFPPRLDFRKAVCGDCAAPKPVSSIVSARPRDIPLVACRAHILVSERGRFPIVAQVFHKHVVVEVELELIRYFTKQITLGHLRDKDPGKMASFLIDLCSSVRIICPLSPASPNIMDIREASRSIIIYFFRTFGRSRVVEKYTLFNSLTENATA